MVRYRLIASLLFMFFFQLFAFGDETAPNVRVRENPPQIRKINALPALTLKDAIDRVLGEAYEARALKLDREDAAINYQNAWDTFFLPSIGFTLSSSSARTLGAIGGTTAKESPSINRGYPSTTLTLGLANYTLFNFWRDRITYDLARLNFDRAQQRFSEVERSLRNRVTNAYFQTKANQDRLEIALRSLNVAKSILGLVRSRAKLGLTTDEEVASSSADVTNAQIAVDQAQASLEGSYTSITSFLNYPASSRFNLTTALTYRPVEMSADWAVQMFKQQAPGVRDQKLGIQSAEASLEIAQKARLPLPTLSVTGLSVSYTSGPGPGTTAYGGNTPPGQIDLLTTVSVSIPIVGSGGFLNSRAIRQSVIQRERAHMAMNRLLQDGEISLRNSYVNIKNVENQLKNLDSNLQNVSTVLDSLIGNIKNKKIGRLELRDAIEQARSTELSRIDAILNHTTQKLTLLETIGADDFPSAQEAGK